eukprot:CAMPEP_0175819476 /NCGR_PEP_ID=MMETSP0107_2-20121207/8090_1 /TAXON_ID=195067 ORGANISM="Goniomonas pacifica, Strain CCMP1869" /NCGR_SAMPLE_ID=MMETSP0107_2 /ASSEMBLY_ACC=CAM_ASM_000203 /LENGTH=84 /DNA_ID=CAMNT_0017131727 /DNA_START=230 /DNA_END=484 /DNA_ORIENTATION=+
MIWLDALAHVQGKVGGVLSKRDRRRNVLVGTPRNGVLTWVRGKQVPRTCCLAQEKGSLLREKSRWIPIRSPLAIEDAAPPKSKR